MSNRDMPNWTPRERDRLTQLIDAGHSYDVIARRLKRSRTAVTIKAKRLRLGITTSRATLSARDVADVLGVKCSKTVARWIDRYDLPARNAGTPHRPLWRVSWEDLLTWLERRDRWMAWQPSRIPDRALREWAEELRSGPGCWLTHTQVARQFCVDRETPGQWITKGLIPATRYGNWWVWSEDLIGFVIPSERPRSTDLHGDATPARVLAALAAGPQTNRQLADRLGIPVRTVNQALLRLQERGLVAALGRPRSRIWAIRDGVC